MARAQTTSSHSGLGNGYTTRVLRHRRTGEVTGLEARMPWEMNALLNTGGRHTYGVYKSSKAFLLH